MLKSSLCQPKKQVLVVLRMPMLMTAVLSYYSSSMYGKERMYYKCVNITVHTVNPCSTRCPSLRTDHCLIVNIMCTDERVVHRNTHVGGTLLSFSNLPTVHKQLFTSYSEVHTQKRVAGKTERGKTSVPSTGAVRTGSKNQRRRS